MLVLPRPREAGLCGGRGMNERAFSSFSTQFKRSTQHNSVIEKDVLKYSQKPKG